MDLLSLLAFLCFLGVVMGADDDFESIDEVDEYELQFVQLCINGRTRQDLRCYLDRKPSGYYFLAPAKVEQLAEEPRILMFHDLLRENSIKELIGAAKTEMEPALTVGDEMENGTFDRASDYRIGKVAFLFELPVLKKLESLVTQLTGLDATKSEGLQVGHYPIGGRFLPHVDALYQSGSGYTDDREEESGDRLATFLIYLNKVGAGGGTAFPELDIAVKPEKGSAILWYNFFHDGTMDENTRHGGCPVLAGEKWIGTLWIRQYGNEFAYPCGLEQRQID